MEVSGVALEQKLRSVFGFKRFREGQEEIMQSILGGHDTFVIMPTGKGKSLCYQLPALEKEGVVLIISPLIALMKNQVDQLSACGVSAYFLNSSLRKKEELSIKEQLSQGKVKLLYIAPESLAKPSNIEFFRSLTIAFVAIDEAHCISEWGHDFRPEYRRIREVLNLISPTPIVALTATATPQVQLDIQHNLRIKDAHVFKSSFNRPNLYYEVVSRRKPLRQLIEYLSKYKGQSGIIYCLTRKKVEEVCHFLRMNGIRAGAYHAGMRSAMRVQSQDAFLNEDIDVMVATVAFGMGINKPDVRFVIHYHLPKSLEGYYQETGRAGRDGKPARCTLLFSYEDIAKIEKFNKDKSASEKEKAHYLLEEVLAYAESAVCRRKQLLHYFGDHYEEESCEYCDNCCSSHPPPSFEYSRALVSVLQIVKEAEGRPCKDYLLDKLINEHTELVTGHIRQLSYGKSCDGVRAFWRSVIYQSTHFHFIHKTYDYERCEVIESIRLTPKGERFLIQPYAIFMRDKHCFTDTINGVSDMSMIEPSQPGMDSALYKQLNALRKQVAKARQVPPYVIFQKSSLEEMALVYPTNESELCQVNGVGIGKAKKFGAPFLDVIRAYVSAHNLTPSPEIMIKSSGERCRLKIQIIQQVDRKIDLREIARSAEMSLEELLSAMERICYAGTKLCISYHIEQIMDNSKREALYQYFMHSNTDDLETAYKHLDLNEFSTEEIRMVRIQFISDLGN